MDAETRSVTTKNFGQHESLRFYEERGCAATWRKTRKSNQIMNKRSNNGQNATDKNQQSHTNMMTARGIANSAGRRHTRIAFINECLNQARKLGVWPGGV